jgi:hypothetical protein
MKNFINNITFSNSDVRDRHDKTHVRSFEQKPTLDKIIHDNYEFTSKQNQPTSTLQKIFTYPSLSLVPLTPLVIGEMFILGKLKKLRTQVENSTISKAKELEYKQAIPKKLLFLGALSIPLYFISNFLNNKYKNEHFNNAIKKVDEFNAENKSNTQFVSHPINSSVIAALADPISGKIIMGNQLNEDLILSKTHQKHLLNHELVHMKQYSLMACSENGIEKINYLAMKKLTALLDENAKKELCNAYQEIQKGTNDNYQNATINRFGYKINLIDYITAAYKIIYEKNTTEKDIPIIINKTFYKEIRNKKGKLSLEEEKKAQEYFEAYNNYPLKISFLEVLNPKSDYRQNLLEKEAYKLTPWYAF